MALQICPKCKNLSFTWYIDEEESSLTQWNCKCGYHAFEDENKQRDCPVCRNEKSDLHLSDNDSEYWWCYRCGKVEMIDSQSTIYIDKLIKDLKVPIIDSLIFPNGDLLVLEHTILGEYEKHIVRVLCKSTIKSYFEYNAPDSVSSCYVTISTENADFLVYAGEGSWGGDGIIYVIRKTDSQLVWFFFSDRSNPFKSVEIKNNEIIAISTLNEYWVIPILSPEKMTVVKLENE